jgi:Tol biopolymer transport system component
MKTISTLITAVFLFAQGAGMSPAQSGYDLFQKALVKERAEGNIEEAIKLYLRIVQEHANNRALAAKAQLRVGVLYERLGRKAEAQRAFQAVVSQYGDQATEARQAQAKIAAHAKTIGREDGLNSRTATTVMVRQVWTGPEVDAMGSPSPDGRYLSFVDWTTGDLALRDLATGKNRRLTNKGSWFESGEFAEYSRISPDGRQIAYTWTNDKSYELRIIGLDGSTPRVLYRHPELSYIQPSAWFPDGKQLVAVFSRLDHTNQIVLVSAVDGSIKVLKTVDWRYPEMLSLSADGRWIAYDFPPAEDAPQRDIFLLATDGSQEITAVEHPSHDFMLGWSPDGERIIFASDRTGTISVWSLRVVAGTPQGSPELLRQNIGRISPIGFTRDGSFLYGSESVRDVYIGEFDATSGQFLAQENATHRYVGANYSPAWSPTGEHLAYLSRRGPPRSGIASKFLVIQSVKTGEERELAPKLNLPTNIYKGPCWSPDGRFLVVGGKDEKDREGFYRVNAQTGEVNLIVQAKPKEVLYWPQPASDGNAILFQRVDEGKGEASLVLCDLETSEEKTLHRSRHIQAWAVSPDGRQLAIAALYSPKDIRADRLIVSSITGEEPKELFRAPEKEVISAIAWMPDARSLLFIRDKEADDRQRRQVWRIPVTGGTPEPVPLQLEARQLKGLRFHPDGKRVVLNVFSTSDAGILMMENFLPRRKGAR